ETEQLKAGRTDLDTPSTAEHQPSAAAGVKHTSRFERLDLLPCVPEIVREHLSVVFAEHGGFERKAFGKRREAERKSRRLELPENTVLDRPHGSAQAKVRMRNGLRDRKNG